MQKFDSKTDPNKLYLPNQMPMFAGSPGYLTISKKQKITYIIAWLIFGLSAGVMNASCVVFLDDFAVKFALEQSEATLLMCVYFMFSSWASLFLFKIRQHFGVHFFMRLIAFGLCALLLLRLCFFSYAAELAARAILGILCICMSIAAIFYAGSFLPATKRTMMLLLGLGLMQLGMPLAKLISPFLQHDGAVVDNLLLLENSLCVLCLCIIYLAPLPPSFKTPSFNTLNIISMSFFALSAALLCFSFSFASVLWWDNPLLQAVFSLAIALFALLVFIETNRRHPLLNIRFLSTIELLKVVFIAALMRVFLAEQNISTAGFFIKGLKLAPSNMLMLYAAVFLASLAALIVCYHTLKGFDRFKLLVWLSFAFLSLGSYLNSNLSPYSSPNDLIIAQSLIAFASVYFLAPLMIDGMLKSFVRGSAYLVSFAAIFGFAQNVFGLLGGALINYYLAYKNKFFTEQYFGSFAHLASAQELEMLRKNALASAYSEMFYLVFLITFFISAALFIEWAYLRLKNINVHARELQLLGSKMQKREQQTQMILAKHADKKDEN